MTARRLVSVALVVAGGGWVAWAALTAPPPARHLELAPNPDRPIVRGAYHIHSRVSDGTGTPDDIARDAARAGLDFVIITDHGDATRPVPAPRIVDGVLCIEAVEISTAEGHYVALGLPTAPYPLAGDARDVVEDVARLGGFGVAAHPDSAKVDLQWRAWEEPVPGVEWFNGDSQWRDEPRLKLPPLLVRYLRRPAETVATLFDRPTTVLTQWDTMSRVRPVVALAGHDAHRRLGLVQGDEPGDAGIYLPLPSYRRVFEAFSLAVELDHPFAGHAADDAAALLAAIRGGRVYTTIDAVAGPAQLTFSVRMGARDVRMGERVPLDGPFALRVRSNAPRGSTVVLLRDGIEVNRVGASAMEWFSDRPGVYRVEIHTVESPGEPPIPWVLSNPIAIGVPHADLPSPAMQPAGEPWRPGAWRVEHSHASMVELSTQDETAVGIAARYSLSERRNDSPFVAVVTDDVVALPGSMALQATVAADRPMRLSVQLRVRGTAPNARWRRSVYISPDARQVTLPFDTFRPVVPGLAPLRLDDVGSLLFVVDTTNTTPGGQGSFTFGGLRLVPRAVAVH